MTWEIVVLIGLCVWALVAVIWIAAWSSTFEKDDLSE